MRRSGHGGYVAVLGFRGGGGGAIVRTRTRVRMCARHVCVCVCVCVCCWSEKAGFFFLFFFPARPVVVAMTTGDSRGSREQR